jgi:hypothetical protein
LNRRAPLSDSEQHERYFGTRANLHSLTFSPAYDLLETPLPMDTIAVAQLPMPTIIPLDTDATCSAYRACGVGLRGHTSSPAYEASWHASEDATPATSSKAAFAHIVAHPSRTLWKRSHGDHWRDRDTVPGCHRGKGEIE